MGTTNQASTSQVTVSDNRIKSSIEREIDSFEKSADSLIATFPLTMWFVNAACRGANAELHKFVTTKCMNTETIGQSTTTDVPAPLVREVMRLNRRVEQTSIAIKAISRSYVVSLISQHDSFLGGLLRALFYKRPELLNASERRLTFKDLKSFESISAARDFVVEKEVETLIRKSHAEQFDWLEHAFSIKLRKGLESWKTFMEVTERRNLFVHCEGRVSSQYLMSCRQQGIDCANLSLGSELTVSQTYFAEASECVLEIGLKLGHVLWRKLAPDEREAADANLNRICLDLISDRRYRLAIKLLDFATNTLKSWGSEATHRIFVLNRAQAYKWMNDDTTCEKILAAEDWTAVEDKFAMAVAVLKNDFGAAVSCMRRVGNVGSVPKEGYRDWPIFREFRKTAEFKKCYEETFAEEFPDARDEHNISYTFDWGQGAQPVQAKPDTDTSSKPN